MEKEDVEISTVKVIIFAVIAVLIMIYLYLLDNFLRKNYWWIFIIVIYLVYFIFQDMNLKRKEEKENCSPKLHSLRS